ncbi:sensor histidine kinase [Saccharibacillus qingshengii]|uniref:sensor histidine kinase n=1 Tax=Saccharibacillus qingshengii TaxID=1763540 RepID=UPI001552A0B7|nr:HAMP domain-containing sensor histidine kinase [Saccharibacillus qingshengii]
MNKFSFGLKLKVQLIAALLLATVMSVLFYAATQYAGDELLNRYFTESSFESSQNRKTAAQLSAYVAENHLRIQDAERISEWVDDKKYVRVYIYRAQNLIYSSDGYDPGEDGRFAAPLMPEDSLFDVSFLDGETRVFVESFFEYRYYNIVTFSCLALSFALFLLFMVLVIHRKTSYIEVLENEIQILEGGNLEYPITIRGQDELSSLARSVNEMRKSFIERLANEEEAKNANNELVTAMSHDLRTPLTALIGYLDILKHRKYKTEEQFTRYLANSKDNAYQIKHLSDQLFEYFTFAHHPNELPERQTYNGIQLIDQSIGIHSPLLVNEGFQIVFTPCPIPFALNIHVLSIQRVFGNLFTNIIKYADKSEPVKIQCSLREEKLQIEIENAIDPDADTTCSTGIGIKVCEKIIQNHGGSFEVARTERTYRVRFSLDALLED